MVFWPVGIRFERRCRISAVRMNVVMNVSFLRMRGESIFCWVSFCSNQFIQ